MDPRSLFRDWGIWGWTWALGWFGFVLGLVMIPDVVSGSAPFSILFLPVGGAALMLTSSHQALKAT